ncbi:MAG: adenosylcobinamide-GDP ribazoletransferase [Candidatus Omnitrophica bacterium]|nr:adenosylcobinamide-GDP ribazoletransferase [Candidatus Omnitrophota bacterium]
MRSFLAALQFLTIVPIRTRQASESDLPLSMVYFPLVGLLIGLILIMAIGIAMFFGLNDIAINSIIVVLLVLITGGLHLDGLADTFDAIASGKPKDEMLKIMRDPHIGTMGVLALLSALLLKLSFLFCMSGNGKIISIILMCVLSRWSMVMVMSIFPYARDRGKAKTFIEGINPRIVAIATLITIITVVMVAKFQGIVLFVLIGSASYLFAGSVARKIGGITGDTLGAVCELMEVVTLFLICVINGGAL